MNDPADLPVGLAGTVGSVRLADHLFTRQCVQ